MDGGKIERNVCMGRVGKDKWTPHVACYLPCPHPTINIQC